MVAVLEIEVGITRNCTTTACTGMDEFNVRHTAMNFAISFETRKFDLEGEEENPINPIKGKSVGEWMVNLLELSGVQVTDLDAEDWGWYSYAIFEGNKYLVGFIALPTEGHNEAPEIIVQVDKSRSFWESLLGKNKMTDRDPLFSIILTHIKSIKDVANIELI